VRVLLHLSDCRRSRWFLEGVVFCDGEIAQIRLQPAWIARYERMRVGFYILEMGEGRMDRG